MIVLTLKYMDERTNVDLSMILDGIFKLVNKDLREYTCKDIQKKYLKDMSISAAVVDNEGDLQALLLLMQYCILKGGK